jgi:hypothetical protein
MSEHTARRAARQLANNATVQAAARYFAELLHDATYPSRSSVLALTFGCLGEPTA